MSFIAGSVSVQNLEQNSENYVSSPTPSWKIFQTSNQGLRYLLSWPASLIQTHERPEPGQFSMATCAKSGDERESSRTEGCYICLEYRFHCVASG